MYQLKKGQESFTVVEGPLGMRTFNPGESYEQIPPGMEEKFEVIPANPSVIPAEAGIQENKTKKKAATEPPTETSEEVQ